MLEQDSDSGLGKLLKRLDYLENDRCAVLSITQADELDFLKLPDDGDDILPVLPFLRRHAVLRDAAVDAVPHYEGKERYEYLGPYGIL